MRCCWRCGDSCEGLIVLSRSEGQMILIILIFSMLLCVLFSARIITVDSQSWRYTNSHESWSIFLQGTVSRDFCPCYSRCLHILYLKGARRIKKVEGEPQQQTCSSYTQPAAAARSSQQPAAATRSSKQQQRATASSSSRQQQQAPATSSRQPQEQAQTSSSNCSVFDEKRFVFIV